MVHARLTPMPPAELEDWRAARRGGPDALPEAVPGEELEALVVVVDDVAVGGVLVGCSPTGDARRCSVRALETTIPSDATEVWAAVLTAIADHARDGGADAVITAVPPRLAPLFQASGYRATLTTHAKTLDADAKFQEDRRVAVRPMDAAERRSFAADARGMLEAGMLEAGLLLGPDAPLERLHERLDRLAEDPLPAEEVLVTATVDGQPVGRCWGTLVERDGGLDFLGHVIELFAPFRGQRLTPSFLGAMSRHVRELDVRDVSLRLYGHDQRARRSFVEAGVALADVHLRRDL